MFMLPANVQHSALSLPSGYLYGQPFNVEGLGRDLITFELKLSSRAKRPKAVGTALTCYEQGLQDPDLRTRAIHIGRIVHIV
jgi:hypothetical protein